MPIYSYKCESCGFAKDVLQKMSDAQLTDCPSCAASTFRKQLTAAGFLLKGSGWYATDFKGAGSPPPAAEAAKSDAADAAKPGADAAKPASDAGASKTAKASASSPAPTPVAASGAALSSASAGH